MPIRSFETGVKKPPRGWLDLCCSKSMNLHKLSRLFVDNCNKHWLNIHITRKIMNECGCERSISIVDASDFLNAVTESERLSKIGIIRGVFPTGQEALASHWMRAGSLAGVELVAAPHPDMPSPWLIPAGP